jgi:hypothetical protein
MEYWNIRKRIEQEHWNNGMLERWNIAKSINKEF